MAVSGSHGHGQEYESVKREDADGNPLPPPADSDEAKKLVGPSGAPLNGQGETDQLYDMESPEGATPAITAFIVYQNPDGKWLADNDLDKVYILQRAAHHEDMYAACSVVVKDIHVIQQVNGVIQGMAQVSQQLAHQQQQQRIAEDIAKRGGFRAGGPLG